MKLEFINEYYSVHDHDIKSYNVDIEHKFICLNTVYCKEETAVIRFEGLLCHKFDYVLDGQNIILCINEVSIATFLQEEKDFLEDSWQYGFPRVIRGLELQSYLEQNEYRIFYIESAIGFSGFVISKDISITISPVVSDKGSSV